MLVIVAKVCRPGRRPPPTKNSRRCWRFYPTSIVELPEADSVRLCRALRYPPARQDSRVQHGLLLLRAASMARRARSSWTCSKASGRIQRDAGLATVVFYRRRPPVFDDNAICLATQAFRPFAPLEEQNQLGKWSGSPSRAAIRSKATPASSSRDCATHRPDVNAKTPAIRSTRSASRRRASPSGNHHLLRAFVGASARPAPAEHRGTKRRSPSRQRAIRVANSARGWSQTLRILLGAINGDGDDLRPVDQPPAVIFSRRPLAIGSSLSCTSTIRSRLLVADSKSGLRT